MVVDRGVSVGRSISHASAGAGSLDRIPPPTFGRVPAQVRSRNPGARADDVHGRIAARDNPSIGARTGGRGAWVISAVGIVSAVFAERILLEAVRYGAFAASIGLDRRSVILRRAFSELVSNASNAGARLCRNPGLPALRESVFSRGRARNHRIFAVFGGAGFRQPSSECRAGMVVGALIPRRTVT